MTKAWPRLGVEEACELIVDCLNRTAPIVEYPTDFKMIRTTNVRDGWINFDGIRCVSEETYEIWTRRAVPKRGDILLTREAPLGEVGIVRTDDRIFLGQRLVMYRVNPAVVLPEFLYYAMLGDDMQVQIRAFGFGSTVSHMRVPDAKKLTFTCPPIEVQREVVQLVCCLDQQIDIARQQIKLLEEASRLIYTDWFVRLRFPGHKRKSPAWPAKPLNTIADINAESIGKQALWDTLLYVDISSVSPGLIEKKIEYFLPDAPGRAKRLVAHGDIIWSCVRPNRRSHALILNPEENLVVSTGFATIRSKSVPWTYLYLALTADSFVAYLESHAQGAAYPAVTGRDFEKAEILVPPPDVLEQFDQLAKPIFEQIETLKSQIEKLRQARDLLLPRLISGQLRL